MAIRTGLSVPVFNVLKYFFIIIFIENIARRALNNIHIFLRKFDLYKGKGTPLSSSRIDRYNLLQVLGRQRFASFFFWIVLVICFYAVEIMFEFSSDAVIQKTVHSEKKLVYDASYTACEPFDVLRSFVANRMTEMAVKCVEVTDNEYILYKPLWIRDEISSLQTALCAKIPENELQRGQRIYADSRYKEGTQSWDAVADLRSAVKEQLWSTDRNTDTALVVISVSSSHILSSAFLVPGTRKYQASLLAIPVLSRPKAFCGGFIAGSAGEGMMRMVLTACIDYTTTGIHYLQAFGTATVPFDAERVKDEKWTVDVAIYFGIAIRNFTKGVFDAQPDQGFAQLLAYTGFLSVAKERDSESLNKYAATYKHCNLFKIAQTWDRVQRTEVDYANVDEKSVVSLSEWGLAMVISWSILLWMVARYLLIIANRKGMPETIDGEVNIARRWAAWDTGEKVLCANTSNPVSSRRWIHNIFRFQFKEAYLNVETGTLSDDIVAGQNPVRVSRDISKPFKET